MRFRLSVKLSKSTVRYVLDEYCALTFTSKSTKAITGHFTLALAYPVIAHFRTEFFHALVILLSVSRVIKPCQVTSKPSTISIISDKS